MLDDILPVYYVKWRKLRITVIVSHITYYSLSKLKTKANVCDSIFEAAKEI